MRYQDCVEAVQAADESESSDARRLTDANINPATGFATDYLNHFNEAIMLLEMLSDCPDCLDDFLAWRPMSYREHFAASHFRGRDLAIAAYDDTDPALRECLDTLAGTMIAMLEATRAAMNAGMSQQAAGALADRTAFFLKPLVGRAGAVINGDTEAGIHNGMTPQAMVDGLMERK